jgi:hypothetical protein
MGGQGLTTILEKRNIKSRFRVYGIWPRNLVTMVGKFGLSDVFITTKKEEHELSYHLDATYESNNNEVKVATKLLNIEGPFKQNFQILLFAPLHPCHVIMLKCQIILA